MKKIQILELFGGIGSPRIALRNMGIPVKAIDYVEIDEKAVRSYNAMFMDDLTYKTQSVVVWENVKNVLSKHMIHNFNRYLSYMEKLGYSNNYKILDARDYGIPQARKRCFTVSVLGNQPFDFELMRKRPMRDISNFLESGNLPDCYIVTQPSVYNSIGKKGIRRATVIGKFANTITTRQDRTPAQVIDLGGGKYRYYY